MPSKRFTPAQIQNVARILGPAEGDPRITLGVYGFPSQEDLRGTLEQLVEDEGTDYR
jgi:hypothetical protein